MTYPTIDVVVATYNGAQFIQAQIQSILTQDYTGKVRILIRDDGSTDDTIAIIQRLIAQPLPEHRSIELLQRTEGQGGVSSNFAALIAAASADYIALADQDDVWLPYKLRIQMQEMQQAEQQYGAATALLICSDLTVVDAQLHPLHHSFWALQKLNPAWAKQWKTLLVQNMVTGCTTLINKAAVAVISPIPIANGLFHDHWMATAVALHGHVIPMAEQTVLYRQHGANVEAAHAFDSAYRRRKLGQLATIVERSQAIANALQQPQNKAFLCWRKLRVNIARTFL